MGTNDTVHPEDLPHVIQVFTQSIAQAVHTRLCSGSAVRRRLSWFQNNGFPLRDQAATSFAGACC